MNSAVASSRGGSAPSILLVGSRHEDTFVIEAVLSSLGRPILHATTGQEAVRVAADRDPAVVLLDVVLPDMDGLEAVGLLRMRRRTQNTPVVLHCSRELSREQQRTALEVGVVDVVVKPFDPEALRARVAELVEMHVARGQRSSSTAELTAALREARARAILAELGQVRLVPWWSQLAREYRAASGAGMALTRCLLAAWMTEGALTIACRRAGVPRPDPKATKTVRLTLGELARAATAIGLDGELRGRIERLVKTRQKIQSTRLFDESGAWSRITVEDAEEASTTLDATLGVILAWQVRAPRPK